MNMTRDICLDIPLDRVREDARAERDPQAARRLGIGMTPQQARVLAAVGDFLAAHKTRPGSAKRRKPEPTAELSERQK